jgi:flagellar export protein FliJ
MVKDQYRLQAVLEIRRKARDTAAALVAMRRGQLNEAEAELQRRQQAVADCQARISSALFQMDDIIKRGVAANKILVHRTHVADLRTHEAKLKHEVEQQQRRVAQAQGEVEKALDGLKEAAKEMEAVEKHREAWQETIRLQKKRSEQKLNDEISASNHLRRQTEN